MSELYYRLLKPMSAEDWQNINVATRKELTNAISAWKRSGKPDMWENKDDLEVTLHPYPHEGKLSFAAYIYEIEKSGFDEYIKAVESLDEVISCDTDDMEWNEPDGDEIYGYGHYYVHTNIEFK